MVTDSSGDYLYFNRNCWVKRHFSSSETYSVTRSQQTWQNTFANDIPLSIIAQRRKSANDPGHLLSHHSTHAFTLRKLTNNVKNPRDFSLSLICCFSGRKHLVDTFAASCRIEYVTFPLKKNVLLLLSSLNVSSDVNCRRSQIATIKK